MATRWAPRLSGSRLAGGLGVLGALLVLLAGALLAARERAALWERQEERLALLARVLEDHATRSLDTAFLALGSVAVPVARGTPADVLDTLLAQAQAGLPHVRDLAVLDDSGLVLAAADPQARRVRIAPATWAAWPVNEAVNERDGVQAIGPLVPARGLAGLGAGAPPAPAGVSFIPLLRSVRAASGQRLLLVALLNPDALANFQQLTLADPHSAAALLNLRGERLATHAELPTLPPASAPALAALARIEGGSEYGQWQGAGLRDGPQVAAYRALRARPLLVVVETSQQALLAQWRARVQGPAGLTLLAALALFGLSRAAVGGLRAREKARAALDQAQLRIARSERELRAQLGLARSLLASSPLPMAVLGHDRRYLDVNHAWEHFTGRRRHEVLAAPQASYLPPTETAPHDRLDTELLQHGGEGRYEAVWVDPDGQPRDLYIRKASFPGPDGRPAGIVVSFMDISEFREAERATRAARDAALDASQAKSEFIANVSHELRTPLQSILGFSELGQRRAREQPRLAEMFGDVHRAGQRMLTLVNDLLDLSKIERSEERLDPERQDLRPLLHAMDAELRPLLGAKRQALRITTPEQPLIALVDGARLQQVLRNLLANAIKFAPPDSLIELSAAPGRADGEASVDGIDGLVLDVADRGPGVPEAELDQVFEAFVQSSATKDGSGGTGLGLAICRQLVQAHHGHIRARNRAGGGAVFSVWLPAARFGDTQPSTL